MPWGSPSQVDNAHPIRSCSIMWVAEILELSRALQVPRTLWTVRRPLPARAQAPAELLPLAKAVAMSPVVSYLPS